MASPFGVDHIFNEDCKATVAQPIATGWSRACPLKEGFLLHIERDVVYDACVVFGIDGAKPGLRVKDICVSIHRINLLLLALAGSAGSFSGDSGAWRQSCAQRQPPNHEQEA
eukprot:GHVR01125549.1.p2 GENE.GHVR01125549.1~~GHVR01125549.1.p2  ORF type:complete len:112 (-),score=6.34 GHVR01125549.1:333-668(-)